MGKKSSFFIIILVLFFVGTINLCYAQDRRIELIDIKVSNSADRTLIGIKTNQPVDFLHYNLKNPPRLVIDFIGTNIYSQEPEVSIFVHGNIREIKSVLYSTSGEDPKIDSLVFKFKPNVAVRIKKDKNRIFLQVKEHSVISKINDFNNTKRIRANLLASRIAENKKTTFMAGGSQEFFVTADGYSQVSDFVLASSEDKITSAGYYIWALYEASIKEKMREFTALDDIVFLSAENNNQENFINLAKITSMQKVSTGIKAKKK